MVYTIKEYQENQMLSDRSEFSESPSCMAKLEIHSLENPPPVNDYKLVPWSCNGAFGTNNANTFMPKENVSLENVAYLDTSDEVQSTKDEADLSFNATNVLNSGFHIRRGILISSNTLSVLFSELDFKDSSTLESNLINRILSSPTSQRNFLCKGKCPDSIYSDFGETYFDSESTNCSEIEQSSYHGMLNMKYHSVESHYTVSLIKIYKSTCFPTKLCMNGFRKLRKTPKGKMYNFIKNRQFRENALYPNHRRSKRNYSVKDANHTDGDDCLPFNDTDYEEKSDIFSKQEISIEQELSGKSVRSKIAEIRKRIKNLSRGVNYELNTREQQHSRFIKKCKRICDSTISFRDYDEIYCSESLQNNTVRVNVSCHETCEQNLSEHDATNSWYAPKQNKTLMNSRIQPTEQNGTSFSCRQVARQSKFSDPLNQIPNQNETLVSCSEVFNQRETSNFCRQVLNQSEALLKECPSYLNIVFGDLPHRITNVLRTISVPFVVSVFGKK